MLLRPISAYVTTVVKNTYFTSASRAQPVRILLQSTHPDRALTQDLLSGWDGGTSTGAYDKSISMIDKVRNKAQFNSENTT